MTLAQQLKQEGLEQGLEQGLKKGLEERKDPSIRGGKKSELHYQY